MTQKDAHDPAVEGHTPGQPIVQDSRANTSRPRVVIVGAGFGGLSAALALHRAPVDITIVDQQNHHLFQPLLYQVATASLSPADIAGPIRAIVANHKHTQVRLARATGVDAQARLLRLADGSALPYDFLIMATGARHSYFGNDAWSAFAPGLKTLDDATRVRRRVLLAMERAETEQDKAARERLLTFVLIGGGPTGVEMAGAIAELTRVSVGMDFRSITPQSSKIILIEAGERLLASFPPALSRTALTSLKKLGVEVRLNARVTDVNERHVVASGEIVPSATVIWAAGVQASPAAEWIGAKADRAGRIIVEPDFSIAGQPNHFAIGDTASAMMPDGRPIPGIAPAAKQAGIYVAGVIENRIAGKPPKAPFRYRNYGNLATIGRKSAVADFGWTTTSGTIAWLLWSTVHLYFLVGFRNRLVVGANWLWHYFTFDRGARLITGLDHMTPVDVPAAIGPAGK